MSNDFFNALTNLKFEISNWIIVFFILMSLFFMVFSGGILAVETFVTIYIYLFLFYYIPHFFNNLIFNKYSITPIFFPAFCNSIILFMLFVLFGFLNNYNPIKYKEIKFNNNICSYTCENAYIYNLPPVFSINNFLLKRFWQNNEIIYTYHNEVTTIHNKYNQKTIDKPFFTINIKNKNFDFFNIFSTLTPSSFVTEDNSLLDTLVIKDNKNNKKMCFVENIDDFFIKNQFEIYIKNNKILFRSLYKIPNSIDLETNIKNIIVECYLNV